MSSVGIAAGHQTAAAAAHLRKPLPAAIDPEQIVREGRDHPLVTFDKRLARAAEAFGVAVEAPQ